MDEYQDIFLHLVLPYVYPVAAQAGAGAYDGRAWRGIPAGGDDGELYTKAGDDRYRGRIRLARVNRITEHTLWESKCLVRAMTARKLLKEAGIHSTLYLGVGKDEGKMIAHAWLRCGQMYVTGGNGSSYAMVAKFRN